MIILLFINDTFIDVLVFEWQVDLEKDSIAVEISFTNGKQVSSIQDDRPIEGKKLLKVKILTNFIFCKILQNIIIYLYVENNFSEWIAVGFSNYGDFDNADFCVFWVDWKGRADLQVTIQ